MFTIPELPYGQELVMNIRTTWGDKHYVGFTGIEVFSSTGEQVSITKVLLYLSYNCVIILPCIYLCLYVCFSDTWTHIDYFDGQIHIKFH